MSWGGDPSPISHKGNEVVRMKVCSVCGTNKSLTEFYGRGGGRPGVSSACKSCHILKSRHYTKKRSSETVNRSARNSRLKREYGISIDEFDQMVSTHRGICPICSRTTTRWVVDHDHNSGEVRDVICATCNIGLGIFLDSSEVLSRASNYLSMGNGVSL